MKLKYRNDNTFRIIQMTDLHIGSLPHHEDDYKTFHLIDKAIERLDADLVVITGDLIWTEGVKNTDKIFTELMEIFNKHSIPVAIAYGNHDSEMSITRDDLRNMEKKIENLVEKQNVHIVDKRECYSVEIYDKNEENIENVLYIFDSGEASRYPIGIYDWILPEQVDWFREVSKKYKRDLGKRDMVFMHIPLPEYWEASKNIISGQCNETNDMISAPYINTGLFSHLYINGQIDAVFCGHDHDNNFVGMHHGIKLCYGNITGYQCYGDLERGVRIIELNNNKEYKMETKTIEDSNI
ncbi:metallophosphoesterase family protein [Clostridium sp. CCUG 7971]|uniref:metallophosphoesterase family protein n=1 Tax=Clostridium sp. CCUG 7971 TaxID=2811414 RepID=UPI001ABA9F87|nr:metallophosphoesterase family protein [Clostridium sp. CCUG 7971]MBO3445471.1 metallophosphoesterase family protein [Clostridium sp. CCUG 7971]